MPGTEHTTTDGPALSKREERAHRILDAAAELIQRWGYKKTAVEDIAKLAGVAKGTIYLHWKTREDLFVALLLRESLEATRDMIELIDCDPADISLSKVIRHSIYVILSRPLTRALFIQDVSVLGELLQDEREDLTALTQQKLVAGRQLLEFFRARGVLRTDMSVDEQLKTYATIVMGTIVVDQYMPPDLQSSPDAATARLAVMIHATLETADPLAPSVLRELKIAWDQFMQQMQQMLVERLREKIG